MLQTSTSPKLGPLNFVERKNTLLNEVKIVIWKTYPDYPFIQANQFGEIRTIDHYTECKDGRKWLVKGHVLKQFANSKGYLRVRTSVNGKFISLFVHRIVAACFLLNPDNLPEVNHKDCNPKNNAVNNLEWCTPSYNNQYREKYGKAFGRPLYAVSLKTGKISQFKSQSEAARQLGVNLGHVNNVLKGRRNQTGGYWFCYVDEKAEEKIRAKFGDEVARKVKELMRENCN